MKYAMLNGEIVLKTDWRVYGMTEKRFNFVGGYLYDGNKPIGHVEDIKFRKDFEDIVNNLHNENEHIKQTIKEAYKNERTALGRSVLKQLIDGGIKNE